ncbi:hypothetical protein [Gemmiger sp. An120]|uniref:putative ABC transporter permease n=1 Tax=Gemmiger sp. An120 TaxID=1965549 RepID=UPI0013028154|nr:hypothetical protein [Gemmiger sp. An120]
MRKRTITFCTGALGYGAVELAWRGSTHWTMLLAGGLALLLIEGISDGLRLPLALQAAAAAAAITLLELAAGLVCNRLLGWQVWDYSRQWGNLWGQVCPLYSLFWFALCLPWVWMFRRTRRS